MNCKACGKDIDKHVAGMELDDCVHIAVMEILITPIPTYSTSIDAAWVVMEKLADNILFELHNTDSSKWACIAYYRSGEGGNEYEIEDTAPLAICKVALTVVSLGENDGKK